MFVGPVATAAWRNPKPRPDRVTDCIRRVPDSRPRPTMCDLSARPQFFGRTSSTQTIDTYSRVLLPGMNDVAAAAIASVLP